MLIRKILLLAGLAGVLLFSHCKKSAPSVQVFTGVLTLASCGTVIIDLDGQPGSSPGVVWKDPSGTIHPNAVMVKNNCYVLNQQMLIGTHISFKISATDVTNSSGACPLYQCLVAGPDSQVFIYDVKQFYVPN